MASVRLATPPVLKRVQETAEAAVPALKRVQETAEAALAETSREVKRALDRPERHVPVLASLMTPVTVVGYVMAFWRFAADMNWTGQFFISSGLLSRWQVWLALAAAMHAAAHSLNRSGGSKNSALS